MRGGTSGPLVEITTFDYNEEGNPSKLTRALYDQGQLDETVLTFFDYDQIARLWRIRVGVQGVGPTLAREFRYDAGRQRYLVRELDPGTLQPLPNGDLWTDYDGSWAYLDYTLVGTTPVLVQRYLVAAWQTDVALNMTDHVHTDIIGTTRLMTGSSGVLPASATRLFSAFGEPLAALGSTDTRYGYAGSWSYQENADVSFLHVGARYYDPALGRFLQRDPIGFRGGLNVYLYALNDPVLDVDPTGLGPRWDKVKAKAKKAGNKIKKGAKRAWDVIKELPGYVLPGPPVPAELAPDVASCMMYNALPKHIKEDHPDNPQPDPNCPTCVKLKPKSQPWPRF